MSDSCSYEQCSAEFCVFRICQFSGTVLCTSSALFDLILLFAASLKTLLQYRWWQLDVLADDHDSSWMWWSEICSIKPKLSKFAELIHDMCTPPLLIWSFCLCLYNHEKINTSSVQSQSAPSNARAAEESLTARLHTVTWTPHTPFGARNRTRWSSNMEELTFQPRGDMATGILLELDTLGETLEQLFWLFFIILIIRIGLIRNNKEKLGIMTHDYSFNYAQLFSLFLKA